MICWADKLAFLIMCLIVAGILIIGGNFETMTLAAWGDFFLKIILPIWVILRFLDWITGGPRRRREAEQNHIDAYRIE